MVQHWINNAVRNCLDQCYGQDRPMDRLAQYTAQLITEHGWTCEEATIVTSKAMRILKIMLEPCE